MPSNQNSRHVNEELSAYIDNELTAQERERVERHIAQCAFCRSELESLQSLKSILRRVPAVHPPRSYTITQEMIAPADSFLLRLSRFSPAFIAVATLLLAFLFAVELQFLSGTSTYYSVAPMAPEEPQTMALEAASPATAAADSAQVEATVVPTSEEPAPAMMLAPKDSLSGTTRDESLPQMAASPRGAGGAPAPASAPSATIPAQEAQSELSIPNDLSPEETEPAQEKLAVAATPEEAEAPAPLAIEASPEQQPSPTTDRTESSRRLVRGAEAFLLLTLLSSILLWIWRVRQKV